MLVAGIAAPITEADPARVTPIAGVRKLASIGQGRRRATLIWSDDQKAPAMNGSARC